MSVVLVGRRSALRRPGGDSLQIEESAAVLRAAGVSVRVENDPTQVHPGPGDTVVLYNLQRCPDWGDLPERVRGRGARLMLVPLFHPLDRYHREGRRGLDGLAARWVRDPLRFASLRWGREDLRERAAAILRSCDRVLLAHPREGDVLFDAFAVRPREVPIVPPAVPATLPGVEVRPPFDDFVVCAGRVEPLKNPLGVLEAADSLGIPVVFVGALPRLRHLGYTRQFLARLDRSPSLALGARSPSEVRALMAQARVGVLASWTEVLGRVSVEAALEGAAVVASAVGFLPDLLQGPGLRLVPPGDAAGLRAALGSAWEAGRPGPELREAALDLTWEVVGPRLVEALG